jgi:hypothetical protein
MLLISSFLLTLTSLYYPNFIIPERYSYSLFYSAEFPKPCSWNFEVGMPVAIQKNGN